MSAFREFEDAARRAQRASSDLDMAKQRLARFHTESARELGSVLAEFAKAGLFPGINTSEHADRHLIPKGNEVAVARIEFRGAGPLPNEVAGDLRGARITEEIVQAAQAQKIPVAHATNFGNALTLSEHVKEGEKGPETFLRALAAYAEHKGKPDVARNAVDAAERMKTMVASFRQVQ